MLEVLYIFQQQQMMRTMLDSGNLLPDLQIMPEPSKNAGNVTFEENFNKSYMEMLMF